MPAPTAAETTARRSASQPGRLSRRHSALSRYRSRLGRTALRRHHCRHRRRHRRRCGQRVGAWCQWTGGGPRRDRLHRHPDAGFVGGVPAVGGDCGGAADGARVRARRRHWLLFPLVRHQGDADGHRPDDHPQTTAARRGLRRRSRGQHVLCRRRGRRQHLFGRGAHVLVHPARRAGRGAGVARDPGAVGATVHQKDEGLALDPGPARGRRHGSGAERVLQGERGGARDRAVASRADSGRHQCRGLPRAVHDAGFLAGGEPDHLQHGAHDRGGREPRDAAVRGGHRPPRPLQAGHADGPRAESSGTG